MGTNAGACGAFGLLLSNFAYAKPLLNEVANYVLTLDETDSYDPEDVPAIQAFALRFIALFRANGINVPDGANLLYSGTEDDRPADCSTPTNQWILGWGLFTKPWVYPVMDKSFRDVADFHDWVWID